MPDQIADVATSVAAFVGPCGQGPMLEPRPISSFVEFEREFGSLVVDQPLGYAVRDFFVNGGQDALVCRTGSAGSSGTGERLADYAGGFDALKQSPPFNLLCVPPDARAGWSCVISAPIHAAAASLCVERRAMFLIDPPNDFDARTAPVSQLAIGDPAAMNAALYFPYVIEADPLQALEQMPFAPCGAVAGVIARTDVTRGVWQTPAGVHAALVDVTGLSSDLTDREAARLTRRGINSLRILPVSGVLVWGARTLGGAASSDDYRYISVRRLALFLESSLASGLKWALARANDEALWRQIRRSVTDFLHGLFGRGAFQGATPDKAFFVKCDGATTTSGDIARGVVRVIVGFAPLRPAEFVLIEIEQAAGSPQPSRIH